MKVSKKEKKNIIWQWKAMEYLTYGAVFIIPLYFGGGHWFPYNAPKAILISLFAFIMLIFFGLGILSKKRGELSLSITPVHITLFIFLLILTISSLVGVDQHNSFFGVWSQSISLVLLYSLSIFALLLGFLVKRDELIVVKLLTVSFTTSVIISLLSYFGGKLFPLSGVGSTLGNSSFAGVYLLFAICFGVGLFFWFRKYWQKILVALGVFIIVFCPLFFNQKIFSGVISIGNIFKNPLLIMGESNGAIVGVVISMLVIVGLLLFRNSRKRIRIIGLILLISIIVGIFYTGISLIDPESKLHHTFVEEKTGNRFLFWDIAHSGFVEHPLLGNGFNNYIYTFQNHFKTEFYEPGYNVELWTNQPHNVIWEYLSTTGILGLVSFLALLVMAFLIFFWQSKKNDQYKIIKIILAGSLVGYFVQNQFVFDTPISYFALFLVIGIAMGLSKNKWTVSFSNKKINLLVSGVIVVFSVVSIVLFVILPWQESKKWLTVTNPKMLTTGFNDLSKLQEISLLGGVADSAFLIDTFFSKYQKDIIEKINTDKSFEILINTENFLEKEIARQPLNFRSRLVVARIMVMHLFLEKKEDNDLWKRALNHLEKAEMLNSHNPDTYFLKAQLFLQINDFNKAQELIRTGIELVPTYRQGYIIADALLKISPDKNFEKYMTEMENKYLTQP